MWNKLLFFLLFVCIFISVTGQEIDSENPIIVWEEIPNAQGYQLQIRDESEEIILEKDVKEISYKLNLSPGKYSHRVGSYNKFGKISSYSDWIYFNIAKSLPPEVTSEKQIVSSKAESEKKIIIEGKNFYDSTTVTLKNETDTVVISNQKIKKGKLELAIDNETTKEGNYDLILENPRKKLLELKDFYVLKPKSFFSTDVEKPKEKENPVVKDTPPENLTTNRAYPYWSEALSSTLLPGWGQLRKNQSYHAIFFDLGIVLSAGYFYSTLNSFRSAEASYSDSVTQSIIYQTVSGQEIGTIYAFIQSEEKFQATERASERVFNASLLLASFYSFNILDALLWKISSKAPDQTSFYFHTKIQIQPSANMNYSTTSNANSSRIELGIQFRF